MVVMDKKIIVECEKSIRISKKMDMDPAEEESHISMIKVRH